MRVALLLAALAVAAVAAKRAPSKRGSALLTDPLPRQPGELAAYARAATGSGRLYAAAAAYDALLPLVRVALTSQPAPSSGDAGSAGASPLRFTASLDGAPRPAELLPLLDAAADAYGAAKQPAKAVALRRAAYGLRFSRGGVGGTGGELIAGAAALARDLQADLQFDEAGRVLGVALGALAKVQGQQVSADAAAAATAGGGASAGSSSSGNPASAQAVLLKMRASVQSCTGDDVQALATFETAHKLAQLARANDRASAARAQRQAASVDAVTGAAAVAPLAAAGADGDADEYADDGDRLLHIDLLKRAVLSGSGSGSSSSGDATAVQPGDSPQVAALRQALAARLAAALARGPWEHPWQLPRHYVPGLLARPWHTTDSWPQLTAVTDALSSAADALAAEWRDLRGRGKAFPETECIHDAARGSWWHYSVEGPWLPLNAAGCSADAPVACALLRNISALRVPGLRPIRAGYSAVGGRSHLKPHCGNTNAQLKFHVGLIVPYHTVSANEKGGQAPTPVPCARIRVGNETRAWERGRVLFFDDSVEHEVWNDCDDQERVVLQFVFAHPDLVARAEGTLAGAAAAALPAGGSAPGATAAQQPAAAADPEAAAVLARVTQAAGH
jgi:hypothetical protein